MLKMTVATLEEVDEKFRGLYKQVGDTYVLETDDPGLSGLKQKVDEFRNNNRSLFKEGETKDATIAELKAKLQGLPDGMDAEKIQEAMKALQIIDSFEDAEDIKAGNFEKVVERRTKAAKAEWDKARGILEKERDEAIDKAGKVHGELGDMIRDREVMKAVGNVGVLHKGAEADVLGRARSVWQLGDDRVLTAKDTDGTPIYGKGTEPLTMEEWANGLLESSKHLFESSKGSGGRGGTKRTKSGVPMIDTSDPAALGDNLEQIAKGEYREAAGT